MACRSEILQAGLSQLSSLGHVIERVCGTVPNVLYAQFLDALDGITQTVVNLTIFRCDTQSVLLRGTLIVDNVVVLLCGTVQHLLTLRLSRNGNGNRIGILTHLDQTLRIAGSMTIRDGSRFRIIDVLLTCLFHYCYKLLGCTSFIAVILRRGSRISAVSIICGLQLIHHRVVSLRTAARSLAQVSGRNTKLVGSFGSILESSCPIIQPAPTSLSIITVFERILNRGSDIG